MNKEQHRLNQLTHYSEEEPTRIKTEGILKC